MGTIVPRLEIGVLLSVPRAEGKKIVFTNGCFDLIHTGHITYLQKARALGDLLVVGLNSDSSVRRIKGDLRPILSEDERAAILAAFWFVDFVVIFDEPDPLAIITEVEPDYLVKGADWAIDKVIGREFVEARGGHVIPIDLVPGRSTTDIIKTIVERYCPRT